jgi:pimeloyl-ACP methyl ester carboxylesterase
MRTLADEKININGRNIHYKVLSSSSTPANQPFLLCIQGGPGFSSLSMELAMADLEKQATAAKLPMPNLIFFDPVGCGQSDKAEDVALEYSMQNYSEIAARVVEHVKEKFSPNNTMDLRIYGGSFGGMAVMDLPVHRPKWLDDDAEIRLRQIIANVPPNGAGDREYARKFVEDNFKDHPDYPEIIENLNKLLEGKIASEDEYLRFVFALAPLYSDSLEKTKKSFFGKMLLNHAQGTIGAMKVANKIIGSNSLTFMIEGLTGCSLDVLNQFFRTEHSGFNLTQQVRDHIELYAKLPICMIACNKDHMVDASTSLNVSKLLPDSCSAVILNDKHQSRGGPAREVFSKVLLGLISGGSIPMIELENPVIAQHTVTGRFNNMLAGLQSPIPEIDSTLRTLSSLSRSGDKIRVNDNRFEQEDEVAMESVVVPEEKVIAVDNEAVPNSLSRCNL